MEIHTAIDEALADAVLVGRDRAIKDVLFSLNECIGDEPDEDAGLLAAIEIINANFSTT